MEIAKKRLEKMRRQVIAAQTVHRHPREAEI
jgi:hypothetical protein